MRLAEEAQDGVGGRRSRVDDGVAEGAVRAEQILDRRLDQIAARTVTLLRAGADLAAVLDDVWQQEAGR